MGDIPLTSTTFEDDQKIINFCNNNTSDKRCRCVLPEAGINKLQINLFNPYQCWYSPCKNNSYFKTSLITEEQKKCNIVLCNVDLGEVTIDDNGVLTIKNNCISSKNFSNIVISQELLDSSLKKNYMLPDYFSRTMFPLLTLMGFILFLRY